MNILKFWAINLCLTLGVAQNIAAAPKVLSDIAPTHSLVSLVMGELGSPSLLINSSTSPHDYSLRPSDAAKLNNADIIFYTSGALTPWLEDALASLAGSTPAIELIDSEGTTLLEPRESNLFSHDHDHSHGDNHDEHENDADHKPNAIDPHAWLDPSNAVIWLNSIAQELSAIDPENASIYQNNATQAAMTVQTMSAEVAQSLSEIADKPYVVFHDSYHYFESRFDVHAIAAINLNDGSQPSISQINGLQRLLIETQAQCVFSEPQYSQRLIDTVVSGTTVRRAELDPLGVQLTPGPDLYAALIRALASNLLQCLTTGN